MSAVQDRRKYPCKVKDCPNMGYALGMCKACYARFKRNGTLERLQKTGDEVGYFAVHRRKRTQDGSADTWPCFYCGETEHRHSWALVPSDTDRPSKQGPFNLDLSHYVASCRSCHSTFDRTVGPRLMAQYLLERGA